MMDEEKNRTAVNTEEPDAAVSTDNAGTAVNTEETGTAGKLNKDAAPEEKPAASSEKTERRLSGKARLAHQNAPQSDQEGQRPEQETPQVHLSTPEETEARKQWFSGLPAGMLSYVIIIAAVLIGVFAVSFITGHWKYHGYRVIYTKTQEDTVSADYCSVEDSILIYGTDGASLMDRNGEILWDVSYSMSEPDVALRGRTIAIYDTAGSDIVICDKTGQIGTASANRPVVKAEVSSSGNVAAIEEDSANAYIEYYALNGKQIAEIKTSLDNPGYPLDLALSEDGNLIAVSYLSVSGGQQQTSVRIYSFGSAGQSQMDNQIGEFDYTGKIIPELDYLEGSDLLAFSDDGFTLFSGSTVPKEGKTVTVTGDIRSAFCDEAHIGLITEADEGYTLHVYNADGRQSLEKDFDYSYQTMDYTDGEVTLYNNSAFCVYSLSGVLKFDGSYKGSVSFIFSLGRHRYGVVREGGMDLIQLG